MTLGLANIFFQKTPPKIKEETYKLDYNGIMTLSLSKGNIYSERQSTR